MRHLNGVYTQYFNRTMRVDGPLFRGRYRAVLVSEESHHCCVGRYIHLNPVEAGLVELPEEYVDSSYRAYVELAVVPPWLHIVDTLRRFFPGDATENFRRFTECGIDNETREFYSGRRPRPVLGSDEFRRRVQARVVSTPSGSNPEIPDRMRVIERPSLAAIGLAVCRAFAVTQNDLRKASSWEPAGSVARGAMVRLSREVGGHPLGAISDWIGYGSHAAASKAMRRFNTVLHRDRLVRSRFAAARRYVADPDATGCQAKT